MAICCRLGHSLNFGNISSREATLWPILPFLCLPHSTIHFFRLIITLMDDQEFSRLTEPAIEALKRSLYDAEGEADFDVEDNSGALHISFDDPPGKFVISPNSPAAPDLDFRLVHQLQARLVA